MVRAPRHADCGDGGSCPSAALFATPLTSAKAGSDTPRDADRPMYPIRRSDPIRECAPPRVSRMRARVPAMPFVLRRAAPVRHERSSTVLTRLY